MPPPQTFAEFWPQYVLAHREPATRAFHFAGTLLAWALRSFGHPLWSWWADQKMVTLMLAGKMAEEVRRCAEKV